MYAYVGSYLALISFCLLYLLLETKASGSVLIRPFFFVGLLPSIIFTAFRGDVGTDTGTYLQMVHDISVDFAIDRGDFDVEIGFYLVLKMLANLFDSPRTVVNLLGFVIAIYYFKLFARTKEHFLTFSLLIFPLFFFDMTMNGLRYGLAFLLAKHASDQYATNHKIKSLALFSACVSFQLSGALVFFLLRIRHLKVSTFAVGLLFTWIFYLIFYERLTNKFIAYTQLESPDILSGLLPLCIFLACYFNMLLVNRKFAKKFMPLLMLEIASFILAKFTYAGLRFQLLVLFVFFCFISEVDLDDNRRKMFILLLSLLIGVIGFAGTLRHYVDDANVPPTPFLPYQFFWEGT